MGTHRHPTRGPARPGRQRTVDLQLSVPSTQLNGFLIGQHGETMRSLQYLVSTALKNNGHEYPRVNVDVAAAAVDSMMSKECAGEDTMCRAAAEKWVKRRAQQTACDVDEAMKTRRRLSAFLSRRGYAAETIRAALDSVLPRR